MATSSRLQKTADAIGKDYQKRLATEDDGDGIAKMIDFGSIIDLVVQIGVPILKNCIAKRGEGGTAGQLRDPGFLGRASLNVQVNDALRGAYARPRDRRIAARHLMAAMLEHGQSLDDQESTLLVRDVAEV